MPESGPLSRQNERPDNASLNEALNEAVALMKELRGHYGIEDVAGPGHPETEYDELQDRIQRFVWTWET